MVLQPGQPHNLSARGTTLSRGQKLFIRVSGTIFYTGKNCFVEPVVYYEKDIRMLGYQYDTADRTTSYCLD